MKRTIKTLEVSRMTIPKGTLLNTVPTSGLPSKLFLKGSNVKWALELDGECEGVSVVLTSYRKSFSVLANDVVFTGTLRWYIDDEATPLSAQVWDDTLEAQAESPQLWYRNVSYHGPLLDLSTWTSRGEILSYAPLDTPVSTSLELQTTLGGASVVKLDEAIYADESPYRLCVAIWDHSSSGIRPLSVPLLTTIAACAGKEYFDHVLRMPVGQVDHKIVSSRLPSRSSHVSDPLMGYWFKLESGCEKASLRRRTSVTDILANFTIGSLASPSGLSICTRVGNSSSLSTPIVTYDHVTSSNAVELPFECYSLFAAAPNRGDYLPFVMARTITNWGQGGTLAVKYARGVESVPFMWKRNGEVYDTVDGLLTRGLDLQLVPGVVTIDCDALGASDYGLRMQYQNGIPKVYLQASNRTSVTVQQGLRMIAKVSVSVGGTVVAEVIARAKVGANQGVGFTSLVNYDGSAYSLPQDATVHCRSLMVYCKLDSSWSDTDPDAYALGCIWNFGSNFPIEDGHYVDTDLGWT